MYSHTKKVGSFGRYGTRVGRKLRNEAVKVERERSTHSKCPSCHRGKVKRLSAGVWSCKTCSHTFTAGTHVPKLRRKIIED